MQHALRQANPIYLDYDQADTDRIQRFAPVSLVDWVAGGRPKHRKIAIFQAIIAGRLTEHGLDDKLQLIIQNMLYDNLIYLTRDYLYTLTYRGEAAAGLLLREGLLTMTEVQQRILEQLLVTPRPFASDVARSIGMLTSAGYIVKQGTNYHITDAGQAALAEVRFSRNGTERSVEMITPEPADTPPCCQPFRMHSL